MVTPHAICSVMDRLIALMIVANALAACAGHVSDYIPTWPAVLRRTCRLGRAPRNMTPTGRKWTTRLPAIRARTRLSQKPILESLVCPNKRPLNDPVLPVIAAALLTQAESADCPRLLV